MSAVICMATCNGSRWLPMQLESLLAQTDSDWQLLISDDRSTDGTDRLLQDFERRDSRIQVLPPRSGLPGAAANFEYLLQEVQRCEPNAACILLCDQDDFWEADKLALQRQALRSGHGCYTDLALMDSRGAEIAPSFLRQLRAPRRPAVSDLLAQNTVVGCSLALRPSVLELALPFPAGLMNHDWWLALCARTRGELLCLDRPLVRYRQHAGNVIGAFRPARQLFRLPALVERQHAVLCGQLVAVAVLVERLEMRGEEVPAALKNYLARVGSEKALARLAALAGSEFAAPQLPLRSLRAFAALKRLC